MLRFVDHRPKPTNPAADPTGSSEEQAKRRIRFFAPANPDTSMPSKQSSRRSAGTSRSSSNLSDYADSSSDDESVGEKQTERSPVETILGYKNTDTGIEYFCKMRNRPYRDCRWITTEEFQTFPGAPQTLKRYHKKFPVPPPEPFYDESYNDIERVIAEREGEDGAPEYLVKWTNLGYDSCTWETDVDDESLRAYEARNTPKKRPKFVKPPASDYVKLDTNPVYKNGMELLEYQLEGLNWLMFCWYNNRNCILADEMGLGKTVQAVAFMQRLFCTMNLPGPFLVIAPLATLMHWQREFNTWTDMNVLIYMGSKTARDLMQEHEFFFPGTDDPKFDVIVSSYEVVMKDVQLFAQFEYNCLVVDEAHRLKNANSKLHQTLRQIKSNFRVLLTGTPLQNTLEELQSLLEFLHPGQFLDVTAASLSETGIVKLRKKLHKHLLRRLKVDVDKTIATKEETIIDCTMTKTQKQFYRAVLEMNAMFLASGTNLTNIAMEMRKVCLHPYLIKGAEEKILAERGTNLSPADQLDCMIRASGKMILLDKLLPKLKADGHRVLIFSQMNRLLDILQDYMDAVGYKYLRIDGSVKGSIRQQLIDKFNAEDSDIFVFLLCTRAGGLGINLNAADTVIIFDSDWNPQNDLQAQARCHRIGQTKTVKVYRLITKGTYEERMFEIASKKLGLGHAVLDKEKGKELDKLIRQGAYHMLNDVEEENFGEEDIEQILMNRSRTRPVFNEAAGSIFSRANFDVEEEGAVDLEDPNFWEKMLPKQFESHEEENQEEVYMRTRRRQQTQPIEDDAGEGNSHEWKRSERERLQHLLSWYGWGRWEEAPELVGLKRSVLQIKLAARAFIRWLLSAHTDLSQFTTIRLLLEQATSEEFDPNFVNADEAEAADIEFLKQPCMLGPDLVQIMQKKGGAWLKRVELLWAVKTAMEKADFVLENIAVPTVQGLLPADWWTINDDRCLIYGTWYCGFAKYDDFMQRDDIPFTCKSMPDTPLPSSNLLTPRLKKLATGIRRLYSGGGRKPEEPATDVVRPKTSLWKKRDRSTVLQRMLHEGVPLKEDGSYDWEAFREVCQFTDKTEEQVEKFVEGMMSTEQEVPEDEQQKEKGDEKENHGITAARIKQRFVALTGLRRMFLKHPEPVLKEYFSYLPRWRNVPRGWTNQMEYVFFKEISIRGWGVCGDILKGEEFKGVFDGEPPTFVTQDTKVIRRLDSILSYVEQNSIEHLREREAVKPKKREKDTSKSGELPVLPDIPYHEDGTPVMPLSLTSTSWICDLGKIVTDRTGFHTERYIYPAGFKSSRLYASTLDPNKRTRYTSEILDIGDQMPLFRVTMDERPDIFYEGNSPTSPWNLILKRVLELRTTNNPKALSVSGPEFYGLAAPAVIYLIQNMEGAEKCVNYTPRKFAPPNTRRLLVPRLSAPPRVGPGGGDIQAAMEVLQKSIAMGITPPLQAAQLMASRQPPPQPEEQTPN